MPSDALPPELLHAGEQSFQQTIDSIPGLVYAMTAAGEVELVNHQVLDYFGRTLDDLKRWAVTDAVHPDDLPRLTAAWSYAVESGETYDVEQRLRRADGEYRWFHGRTLAVRDNEGHIVRWIGLLTSIDDLKRTQEELRASEQRFRLIVDSIPGLVYTMTPSGDVDLVNRQILDYFGRPLDELKSWTTTDAVHPNDLPRVIAAWKHALESGQGQDLEHRLRRADGVYRWFHLRAIPLVGASGEIVRWYGLLTDIDDRKRAERRLRRATKARYEVALAERTRIAQELHDTLLQGFTGITFQLRAIQRRLAARPAEVASDLEGVLATAENTLRDARHMIWDMRTAELEERDLADALAHATRQALAGSTVDLAFSVSGERRRLPLEVETTAIRIGREAVLNALKHAALHTLGVHLDYRAQRLNLQVTDDGTGIVPGTIEAAVAGGHWGIAGMRARAERAHGTFEIASVPGHGTTVSVSLPLGKGANTMGDSPEASATLQ